MNIKNVKMVRVICFIITVLLAIKSTNNAFCDEIEDAASAGDFVKLRALLKNGHKFDEFLDAVRADDWSKQKNYLMKITNWRTPTYLLDMVKFKNRDLTAIIRP